MSSTGTRTAWPGLLGAFLALAITGIGSDHASAQTYGFATLPPGTLNHTTASAISKIVKEKGGMNMLVQPTAGDQVINPLVGRGEVEIGITNIMEAQDAQWAPISHRHHGRDTLHDRASYRYFWQVLDRAHRTGQPLPAEVRLRFFP